MGQRVYGKGHEEATNGQAKTKKVKEEQKVPDRSGGYCRGEIEKGKLRKQRNGDRRKAEITELKKPTRGYRYRWRNSFCTTYCAMNKQNN